MTRIVYNTATTLNGFIADESHSLAWLFAVGEEGLEDHSVFMESIGVLVQGSTTYEWVLDEADLMAQPHKWKEFYGERPTFVFSTRKLPVPEGADVRFVRGEVSTALASIVEAAGHRDVWVVGGGDLAGQFADAGALTEIMLSVAPVALAGGAPLLPRRLESSRLRLESVKQEGQFAKLTYSVS